MLHKSVASKGKSHLLIRKKPEKEESKSELGLEDAMALHMEEKDDEIDYLKSEVEKLKNEIEQRVEDKEKADKYGDLLNDLFQKGIIDATGSFVE